MKGANSVFLLLIAILVVYIGATGKGPCVTAMLKCLVGFDPNKVDKPTSVVGQAPTSTTQPSVTNPASKIIGAIPSLPKLDKVNVILS